jgi:ATP-dependent DNA helicase RecQ
MTDPVQQTLEERFGLSTFREGQRLVIDHLLAGRSAAAVFPTGGGKSLCYQLPALLLPGLTVVVSPLIALMKDQIDGLRARGIAAARMDSTLGRTEYTEVLERIRSGDLRLLYVAPERFNNERFRDLMRRTPISLLAIDEAHCISEWGHNFRPDYLKLASYAEWMGAERVLALTATATDAVLEDIRRAFAIAPDAAVRTPFYRANLELRHHTGSAVERNEWLLRAVAERPVGPTIVYVTLQRTAEEVAELLGRGRRGARHYHAGMSDDERAAVQEWFMASDDGIVVATIAFGMGIDKADIRYVYHFNPPKSLENYAQEIGRAGRDGESAWCEAFLVANDLNALENFAFGDTPSEDAIAGLIHELFGQASEGETLDLSLYELSNRHDIRPLVLRTLMTRLELDGWLESGTPIYATHDLKPLVPSKEMLARYEDPRRSFVGAVLASTQKKSSWFAIDLDAAMARTGATRGDVLDVLNELEEAGLIEVKSGGVRNPYRVARRPPALDALVRELSEGAVAREQAEQARLAQVVALATATECQVGLLNAHFGQPLARGCGHCGACAGERAAPLPPRVVTGWERRWDDVLALLREGGEAAEVLSEPRRLARFACGLTSPRLTRAKLSRHRLFGCLEEVPFAAVLERARRAG